jgi:hypothetical protein
VSPLEALAVDFIKAKEAEKEAGNKFVEFMQPSGSRDFREYFELQGKAEEASKVARSAFAALSSHVKAAYATELEKAGQE